MELVLTTERALAYEERTGKDLLETLQGMQKTKSFKIRDVVEIFKSCGDGYDLKKFDEWKEPLNEKVIAIMQAVQVYIAGKGEESKNQ